MIHSLPPTDPELSNLPPTDADDEVFVFPASFAQQRMWFFDQFEPGSPGYNIPSAVRMTGRLNVAALEQALNEVVRRHETLRTTFAVQDGQPVQVISPALQLKLTVTDLQHLAETEREAEAMRLVEAEAREPFNLSQGPLLRARLLQCGAEDFIFLCTMHHIISDGWSMSVFIGELTTLYHAFSNGRPSPLAELPIQYADYAHWQRAWLQGEVLEAQLAYWKKQLGGELPVLNLPTDRPRPAVQTSAGANLHTTFSRELTEAIQRLSRHEGATLFMTLMAAFQTLLYRYTGQTDITTGSPIANRQRPEIEGLIGCFINTLVLRSDLSGNPTFRELLRRVRETTLEAYAHQDLPFETLVEQLQPERDMSHSPLFQVMFILQNAGLSTGSSSNQPQAIQVRQLDVDSGTATFDLTLSVSESADGLSVSAEYNTDLFEAATIERLLGHYRTLLAAAAADADQPVAELPLLTEAERHQILVEWNNTRADFALDRCVHQLIEAQAAARPEAVAVVCHEKRLTYSELDARASQLAHYLQRLGIGPEKFVGICAEKSVEMIIAVLGVLKAGGAYVPLDPNHPADRLSFMLEDAGISVLLTQSHLQSAICNLKSEIDLFCLDTDWPLIAAESTQAPVSEVRPENAAYVIYTSGSTGQPKGVVVEHRSLLNAFLAWREAYELDTVRVHLQMASFAFDVFTGDFVRALCSGGRLVLCPRESLLDAAQLEALLRREVVECAEFVPAVLRHLVAHLERTGAKLDFMRLLICGSDAWYAGEYERFQKLCGPQTRLINSFGLTEATIDSSYFEARQLALAADQLVPIGRPFANTQLYILNPQLQPQPIGVTGELFVGGAGLARGYLNRAELTAEKFIELQIADLRWQIEESALRQSAISNLQSAIRLYRTGDLARFLPDGNIQFLGRADYQVKIRGFRIEPGEIEAVLATHEGVRQVVIAVCQDARGADCLVAYVTVKDDTGTGELRRFATEKLPAYMVPSAFVLLDEMPLNANGKVDRNALPAPEWDSLVDNEYVGPRNRTEELLAESFAQVLGLSRVGIHEVFFEIGGHSLLATQLVSRVREAFGLELPLRNVFEFPTVAALAEQIARLRLTTTAPQAPPVKPVARDGELPLSFAQQRLWFLEQLEPGSAAYNIPDAFRLSGPLDVAVLSRCLNEIIRRHEILRTTFHTVGGKPVQVIAPELTLPLPVISLESLDAAQREAEVARLARESGSQPFDLARGPLLRVKLLRLAETEHVLLLTVHHIISDDWSSNVMFREIALLYQAFSNGQPSPLAELPIQYADYAHWQRAWLRGEVLAEHLNYWKQQLSDSPSLLELPTDRPRPGVQTFNGSYETYLLPPALAASLNELSRREGATLFMTLLAAFQTLLHRYSGQEVVNVGTPIANRTRAEVEGLIGLFINTLVMHGDLSGDPQFRQLLQRTRETALGAYAHQDLPFEMIVDELKLERNLSYTPLFQVMFVLQNAPLQMPELPGAQLQIGEIAAHSGASKFDLTLFATETSEGLSLVVEYNTDLFDATTIQRLLGHYEVLLTGIAADADQHISRLPLLAEAERHQLFIEWNDTQLAAPHDRTFQELFEQQAARTPDAQAVIYQDQSLTFAELNRRANQVAHHLRRLGIGPDSLVALFTERSLEMMVGLVGILKAGGAYVPLDPSYPADRLGFVIEDAQASVVLTQQHLRAQITELRAELSAVHFICLDAAQDELAGESTENPPLNARGDNLAYVIFTSGSTGRPKGVMIEHHSALNLAAGLSHYIYGGRHDRQLRASLNAPLMFDASVQQWLMLIYGHAIDIVPQEVRLDGEALMNYLRAHRLDVLDCVPSQLRLLLAAGFAESDARPALVLPGGEAIDEAMWHTLARIEGTDFYNVYGPTECAVDSTTCCVRLYPHRPSIGRPLANVQLYVLDAHQQPVPIGIPGELYIGGAGVGRGYLNRAELTAEKFINWSVVSGQWSVVSGNNGQRTTDHGQRLYRTGDLVRWLPDRHLDFLGRADHQVKIRGFRIELGEIETVLAQHRGVRQSVVVAHQHEAGHQRLVAYVVAGADAVTASELREHLLGSLPDYMVPSTFVLLDALPLTPNGKVDRARLPKPEADRNVIAVEYVAPRNELETKLAAIWQELLGVSQVGIHDNFFELGGDSILSIQIIARAAETGIRLTPKDLFQSPTVAGLAALAQLDETAQASVQEWFDSLAGEAAAVPLDFAEGANTADSARQVTVTLSPDETQSLVQETADTGRTEITDLLMAALAQVWTAWTGARELMVDWQYQSRAAVPDEDAIIRRLASAVPVRIVQHDDLNECLNAVKAQLRRAPHRQSGAALLRYASRPELRQRLSELPQAMICFSYHENDEPVAQAGATMRPYVIEIICRMDEGRLRADLIYSANLHRQATIEALANGLIEALRALLQQSAGAYHAADFADFGWDESDLSNILSAIDNRDGH